MAANRDKTVLILAGPTAVGKTAVAIQLAQHFRTAIISADSRQCFREMCIGVARPSTTELEAVPHYFIASHSIEEEITAASFEQYALEKTNELFKDHDIVIMTGGTGLYIHAFCEGLDEIPPVGAGIRDAILTNYNTYGLAWLQQQVKEKDPAFFAAGETQNPQRMMRALEVVESSGRSVLEYRKGKKAVRDFSIIKLGLELPRDLLIRNINQRVDAMMEAGLLQEVQSLQAYRHLNALQTVGYAELFDYLDGKCTLAEAVEQIKIHTRQYAKRQMTWFKRETAMQWFGPGEVERMKEVGCRR